MRTGLELEENAESFDGIESILENLSDREGVGVAEIQLQRSGRGASHDDAVSAGMLGLVESFVCET
jgi:hypothetical protein